MYPDLPCGPTSAGWAEGWAFIFSEEKKTMHEAGDLTKAT